MNFYFLTIFPEVIEAYLKKGLIKKAIDNQIINTEIINIRDFAGNKHNRVDDYPFGGGPGMLMMPQPIANAIRSIPNWENKEIIYLTPVGKRFEQRDAVELKENNKDIIFICGNYEGIDQRIIDKFVTKKYSIGDFILTGGELPVLSIFDSVSRLIPNVLGNNESTQSESFSEYLLEYPQYTRPREFEGQEVPEVLISGHHQKIKDWQKEQSKKITQEVRPDLYEKYLKNKEIEENHE